MAIDGITPAVVFPLLNFVLRGVQTVYDVSSVPAETTDYLKTISQVLSDVKVARQLRRQIAGRLTMTDLSRIDDVIRNTEDAMKGVEMLVEKARVDMSLTPGRVSASSRIMWVVRDANKMSATMGRLAIASQSLHREIILMKSLGGSPLSSAHQGEKTHSSNHSWSCQNKINNSDNFPSPPSYQQATIDAMKERRFWTEKRNSLARQRSHSSNASSVSSDDVPFPPLTPNVPPSNRSPLASLDNIAEYISHNEEILSSLTSGAPSVPRDTPLPARLIDWSPVAEPSGHVSELEGSTPARVPNPVGPDNLSYPQLPVMQMRQQAPTLGNPFRPPAPNLSSSGPPDSTWLDDIQVVQPRPFNFRPRVPQSAANEARRSQYEPIESEILLPGHTKPYKLRYEQIKDDTDEAKTSAAALNRDEEVWGGSKVRTNPFRNAKPLESSDSLLDRAPTRRRPPRIQRDFHVAASTGPDLPKAQPRTVNSNANRTLSRSEWQLQKQEEELASLKQKGTTSHLLL